VPDKSTYDLRAGVNQGAAAGFLPDSMMLCEREIDIVSEKSGTVVLLKILKN